MDFNTGLPPSKGKTAVLVIVGRFHKAAHYIALPKLSSARESTSLLLEHVFCLHGLPRDVVSDGGTVVCILRCLASPNPS